MDESPTVKIERYWLNILALAVPFSSATRYLPLINFSAISLALSLAGLKPVY
jgi:hypothetical protein